MVIKFKRHIYTVLHHQRKI